MSNTRLLKKYADKMLLVVTSSDQTEVKKLLEEAEQILNRIYKLDTENLKGR
tara:strand:- start:1931 stop:2086 length:156 start_codon:yes stop_codon:yes gene_type:complete